MWNNTNSSWGENVNLSQGRVGSLFSVLMLGMGIVFFVTGCAVWHPLPWRKVAEPLPLPEHYRAYYDYPKTPLSATLVDTEKTDSFLRKRVEMPLSLPLELAVENLEMFRREVEELAKTDQKTARDLQLRYLNRIDYYVPGDLKVGEKRPAILISPILGGNMVVDRFARYYAGRGYLVALVHRKRIHWDENKGISQVEDYMRTSVIRLRQAVDWLEAQPEVDPERIGAFGISYGAILHSVLAAIEPRIAYHILAMPAAPLADVIMACPDRAITKLKQKVRELYGWSDEEIHTRLQRSLVTDPIYLAPYVPTHKVQLYIALFDRVVGAGRSFRLWKAMGRPELKILPFGHYGGILVFPYLQTQSYSAFKSHLEQPCFLSLRGSEKTEK